MFKMDKKCPFVGNKINTIVEWYFLEENTVNGLLLAMVGNWVTGYFVGKRNMTYIKYDKSLTCCFDILIHWSNHKTSETH